MRSYKNRFSKMTSRVCGNAYLDGDSGEGKEVEFQEANQYLVVLVHCLVIGSQESHRNNVGNTDSS
jgi:hypothetical protein